MIFLFLAQIHSDTVDLQFCYNFPSVFWVFTEIFFKKSPFKNESVCVSYHVPSIRLKLYKRKG